MKDIDKSSEIWREGSHFIIKERENIKQAQSSNFHFDIFVPHTAFKANSDLKLWRIRLEQYDFLSDPRCSNEFLGLIPNVTFLTTAPKFF